MRNDSKGCVVSCNLHKIGDNKTYEKNGEKKCVTDCSEFTTLISIDETKCITDADCKTNGVVTADSKKCYLNCPDG